MGEYFRESMPGIKKRRSGTPRDPMLVPCKPPAVLARRPKYPPGDKRNAVPGVQDLLPDEPQTTPPEAA